MSKKQNVTYTFFRGVFTLLIVILAVPLLIVMVGFFSYQTQSRQVNAQDARDAVDRAESQPLRPQLDETRTLERDFRSSTAGQPDPPQQSIYRPVTETEYREEQIEVLVPEVDPDTGQTVMINRPQVVNYPRTTTRWVRSVVAHDPRVQQLAGELRGMDEEDESREIKMKELRNRLESEFMQMHEQQAKEISKTEQRLESLKKMHQQRGENKDKIVQRRIDDLLGNADSLQWNPNPPSSSLVPSLPRSTTYRNSVPIPGTAIGVPGPLHIPMGQPQVAGQPPRIYKPRIADPPSRGPELFDSGSPRPNSPQQQNRPANHAPERVTTQPSPDHAATTTKRGAGDATTVQQRTSEQRKWAQSEPQYAAPPMNAPRVEGSTSVISRLFQLARESAAAEADLAQISIELKELTKLHDSGAATEGDLRKAKTTHEKLSNTVRLNKIEFEALAEALRRDLKFAEAAVARTAEKRELIEGQVKNGFVPLKQLLDVEIELAKARNEYEHARASLDQLQVAWEPEGDDETEEPVLKPDEEE